MEPNQQFTEYSDQTKKFKDDARELLTDYPIKGDDAMVQLLEYLGLNPNYSSVIFTEGVTTYEKIGECIQENGATLEKKSDVIIEDILDYCLDEDNELVKYYIRSVLTNWVVSEGYETHKEALNHLHNDKKFEWARQRNKPYSIWLAEPQICPKCQAPDMPFNGDEFECYECSSKWN